MNRKVILLLIATCIVSYLLFSGLNNIMQKQPLSEADIQQHINKLYAGEVKSMTMKDDIAIVSFATKEGIYQVNVNLENSHPSNLTLVHRFVAQVDEKVETKSSVTQVDVKDDAKNGDTEVEAKNHTKKEVIAVDSQKEVTTKSAVAQQPTVSENKPTQPQKNETKPKTNEQAAKPQKNNAQTKQSPQGNKNYKISKQQAIQIALKEQPGIVDKAKFKKTDDGGTYEIKIEHGDYETKFVIHAITGKIITVEFDD